MGPAPSGRSGHAVAAARRVVSPPASNNLTPTRQGAVSPMNKTSIFQRAIFPQQQRSMSPTTNAGERAVSPTTTAESERASSPSSRNVIKLPKGAVTALGAGGVAMTASAGSPSLGWSSREGRSGPPRRDDYSSFTIDRGDKDSTLSTITNITVTEKSRAMCANTSRLRGAMIVEVLRSNGWLLKSIAGCD
ncbi:hypothetical protein FRC02_007762 [Tulasnella sp. 418]|nr:hypothetical protein FRC02_007762 [Tulasnella sp. 418]